MDSNRSLAASADPVSPFRVRLDLFLISLFLLFLELACIRWFPAHVLYLTFFTNVILLACFLGMSIGCLTASRPRHYLLWTPALLALAMLAAHFLGWRLHRVVEVDNASPQMVFFGTEGFYREPARFVIPVEALCGLFFLIVALAMIGPGQELGRALKRLPNRVGGYTLNILGSIAGIGLFAACSWWELSPFWWFLSILIGLGYFLLPRLRSAPGLLARAVPVAAFLVILVLASWTSGVFKIAGEHFWSPYYRIDYAGAPDRIINVNLIAHQKMLSRAATDNPKAPVPLAYALPHLLNRDAQRVAGVAPRPFEDVLIIGAGSGNDVSRALQWGARHVDAVEIDPVVQRLGQRDHPDRPYQDQRVTVYQDDGRNFLRSTDRQYDLIVYALVDSLVLHSGYSNIRLESYLFTKQAFADVRRRLKPGGMFVLYNYFRQGWIVARLHKGVAEVFGNPPLVLSFPSLERIEPEQGFDGYTVVFAGDAGRLRQAFQKQGEYWLSRSQQPDPDSPNGFTAPSPDERSRASARQEGASWERLRLAEVVPPREPLAVASDDWPFLYLRQPMLPALSVRGVAVMACLTLVLMLLFLARRGEDGKTAGAGESNGLILRMFFLGAGFMLLETRAVVTMALLFGSTWMVNSVVFLAVLLTILAANLLTLWRRPERLWPYGLGLLVALVVNALAPLGSFLGLGWGTVIVACVLTAAPIFFAGVIFAVSFGRCAAPERAFGANVAGAMLGGLAESSSLLLGFPSLVLVAMAFYALSAVWGNNRRALPQAASPVPQAA